MKIVSLLGLHLSFFPQLKQAEPFLMNHAFPFNSPIPATSNKYSSSLEF